MNQWKCLGCGAGMWHELAKPADDIVSSVYGDRPRMFVHICGACKFIHFAEGDNLRVPTEAEMVDLERTSGDDLKKLRAAKFSPAKTPEGTMIVSKGS